MKLRLLWPLLLAVFGTAAHAQVKVLSAGAVEPGLHALVKLAQQRGLPAPQIQFNTAPQIAKRLEAGERYDLLIAPAALIAQAERDGKPVPGTRTPVGRVGAGAAVRADAPLPDMSSVESLKGALLAADSIVYNTASTGQYLDKLFAQLGLADALAPKTTRYPDGASVFAHVLRGQGYQIGFGAITEIKLFEARGLRYAGPLPAPVQNFTAYDAAVMSNAAVPDPARALLQLLATAEGRAAFIAAGVE